jgi:hypothetical protein
LNSCHWQFAILRDAFRRQSAQTGGALIAVAYAGMIIHQSIPGARRRPPILAWRRNIRILLCTFNSLRGEWFTVRRGLVKKRLWLLYFFLRGHNWNIYAGIADTVLTQTCLPGTDSIRRTVSHFAFMQMMKEGHLMVDLMVVAIGVIFFTLAFAYIRLCDRL